MKRSFAFSVKGILLTCFLVANLPLVAQDYYPPTGEWERKSPIEMGFNDIKLEGAVGFALENEYTGSRDMRIAILEAFKREPYHEIVGPTRKRGGPAGLIIRKGYIVAEWGDIKRVDMTFSVTKSYLSTVAGLAIDRGLINSVDDPVSEYVWDGTFEGAHNAKITWEHLLNQSSDWSGDLFGMPDWADRPPAEGGISDWKNRKLNEPGTFYKYNDVRVNVLAYSLLQVWRKPLPQVLKEHIMDPIGASTTWRWYGYEDSWVNVDGNWVQSVSGGGHSGGGIFINTLDHARFGLLFLKKGKWEGNQLFTEEWIRMITKPSPANEGYGYMWWLSENHYSAAGFGGNYIIVVPEHDMVIVTRWLEPSERPQFIKMVIESLSLQLNVNPGSYQHSGIRNKHTLRILAQQCEVLFSSVVPGHSYTGSIYYCPEAGFRCWFCLVYICVFGHCFFPGTKNRVCHNEKDTQGLPGCLFLHGNGYYALY